MEITHLPVVVGFVTADECTAIQGYSWGRLISNLCAECRNSISRHRLDVLPTIHDQGAKKQFFVAWGVADLDSSFKIGRVIRINTPR